MNGPLKGTLEASALQLRKGSYRGAYKRLFVPDWLLLPTLREEGAE